MYLFVRNWTRKTLHEGRVCLSVCLSVTWGRRLKLWTNFTKLNVAIWVRWWNEAFPDIGSCFERQFCSPLSSIEIGLCLLDYVTPCIFYDTSIYLCLLNYVTPCIFYDTSIILCVLNYVTPVYSITHLYISVQYVYNRFHCTCLSLLLHHHGSTLVCWWSRTSVQGSLLYWTDIYTV
jgi:hypothetical protein